MFLADKSILASFGALARVHPFFGITFLVCKKARLPVGTTVNVAINGLEEQFLREYYRPDLQSRYFYHPFKTSGRSHWLVPKYPYSGSQSTRTRGDFAAAFIHVKNTDQWGWAEDYVDVLRVKLLRDKTDRIPALALACWIFRNRVWPNDATPIDVLNTFLDEFEITPDERDQLFDTFLPADVSFSSQPFTDARLLQHLDKAPDVAPDEGGTLRRLALKGVGPSDDIEFSPGERLTVITGDNGLGKTFLLDACWWALTGEWAEQPLRPRVEATSDEVEATFEISAGHGRTTRMTIPYDWSAQRWSVAHKRPLLPGLVVYARVDGSFAVWDPARHNRSPEAAVVVISRHQVLYGLEGRIEGLLRDWLSWQYNPDRGLFDTFSEVLITLSPPDLPLRPGPPIRLPDEPREIPTLKHSYGTVPFTHESAAVRRVATLAYLIVWAWNEHRVAASLARRPPQPKMVLLIDEAEAHLHPKWQRLVVPAVLRVARTLSRAVEPQVIVATHSPLVLASLEAEFRSDTDELFHLQLNHGVVTFTKIPFVKYGSIDQWLTSDIFELRQPRSAEAEMALESAKQLMDEMPSDRALIEAVSELLRNTLPGDDDFWPRWLRFAEATS
jgi:hypothetical protein